jgi:NAD(P)-dependent dehydrogenase (short-subunit alcohol dehydrogenase family)
MTVDPFDLTGRTALVVGASRGLGREAALALARRGADVVCAARSDAPLRELTAEIAAMGRAATAIVVDATDEAALAIGTTVQDWERLLKVNLTGAFVAARQTAPHMKARGGRMIFFSTSFVESVLPFTVAYGVSKAGLQQLVQSLAVEWGRYGIRVNAIAPGYFETEMPKAVLDNPELRQRVVARIPLRRVGQPAEIGPLVVYLASEASAFMTGAVLRIDGGQSLNVS